MIEHSVPVYMLTPSLLAEALILYLTNHAQRHPNMLGRADERTRTADLTSLRVIHQALQEFAGPCKTRSCRQLCLLWVAVCCTVLRSRWYQSGVNIDFAPIFERVTSE
jgi:hypothetical protein